MNKGEIKHKVNKVLEDLRTVGNLKSIDELRKSAENSKRGFLEVLLTEKAFRSDMFIFIICVAVALAIPGLSWCERAVMVYTAFVPLVAELINTAIEKTIDRISLEYHRLSRLAKDIGSALVLASFFGAGFCWLIILIGWSIRFFSRA